MKLNEFKKSMKKSVFTWADARRTAWTTTPQVLRLELFNWRRRGEIRALKRGVYCFPERVTSKTEIAQNLYTPSYLSLEWALHHYELLPDVVFSMTSVSTRGSRTFKTDYGEFVYHKLKSDLFFGYDPVNGIASPEKALLDYIYFNSKRLVPKPNFWEEMRWQNLNVIQFKRVREWVKKFGIKKMILLTESLEDHAKIRKES